MQYKCKKHLSAHGYDRRRVTLGSAKSSVGKGFCMKLRIWSFAAVLAAGFAAMAAPLNAAQTQFIAGHADIGVWASGGSYQLKLSSGDAWQADPEAATIVVAPSAQSTIGGANVWKLPQSATEAAARNVPWLGLQVHGSSLPPAGGTTIQQPGTTTPGSTGTGSGSSSLPGSTEEDVCGFGPHMHLTLQSVTGPGTFGMWQDVEADALGLGGAGGPGFENRTDLMATPGMAMSSHDGVGGSDYVCMWPGMHTHANWSFSQPGNYAVTFALTVHDGTGEYTDTATYNFAVQSPLGPSGDLDHSGTIDRSDLALLTKNFGTTSGASTASGDFNGDGAVGLADMMILRNNLGQTSFSGGISPSSTSAVPEPSTYVLAVMAAATLPYVRRRARMMAK
jgi:surface-anchored protein